ncbi:hypothetical protein METBISCDRAFT_16178 [Metschnikowia bicuspidata]|uniref:Mitochondrial 15S rRNA processing factor CCM1 n=1 Tax=Metschnikowia bicuspidata TaxID=27322 RepID=A0A4P9ZC85_9ASCO|nr:hypothetical protein METBISCDRAFT_16178 [Metschnikowia bicuspidata]
MRLVRFQATARASNEQASAESANPRSNEAPKTSDAPKLPDNRTFRRHPSRKLRDISRQINMSVKEADSKQLGEAIDIFEEGLAYLRENQQAESIDNDLMFRMFQRSATELVIKAIQSGDEKCLARVLQVLVAQRVAHKVHFSHSQEFLILQGARHADVLTLWLQYLEYLKVLDKRTQFLLSRPLGYHKESKFQPYDLQNITYFAYVLQCADAGVETNFADALKLLQLIDVADLPSLYQMYGSLKKLRLYASLSLDIRKYAQHTKASSIKILDPNGDTAARHIAAILKRNNVRELKLYYDKMLQASVANELPLQEDTLARVMSAFIDMNYFPDALDVFTTMAGKFRSSLTSWALALKAMGHPKNVLTLQAAEKKKLAETVKITLALMEATGVPVNARTLAVAVGAMANLDRQDEVDALLAKHKNVPVVHLARHNVLLGMIINGHVADAERLMKTYLTEVPGYVPLIQLLNSFLTHYVKEGSYKAAEDMMQYMTEKGIHPDVGTLTTVMNYYFKTCKQNGVVPDVKTVLTEMNKQDMAWDVTMAATLLTGLTQDGYNMDAARAVFKHFVEQGPQYRNSANFCTIMMKAEIDSGDVTAAEDLFRWYKDNLSIDTRVWNMMIAGLLIKHEQRAVAIYRDMIAADVSPNFYTFFYMLKHFQRTGNRQQVQWVLDQIARSGLRDLGQVLPKEIVLLQLQYRVDPALLARLEK